MPHKISQPDQDLFDEAGYLRRNPGLIAAIEAGIVESAWAHYDKHGRREGRLPNDVDPDFYLAAYPVIATDLGRPASRGDAVTHFIQFGRARGYLPHATAPRPSDPGMTASAFGGGWTDRADALDAIRNRFDLGRITDRMADRLRAWVRDGYVVVELGTADDRAAPAALALEQAFAGTFPNARFRCPALGGDPLDWVPELPPNPAAVLDIHMLSQAIRRLILAPPVSKFVTALFDSPLLLGRSEGSLRPIPSPPRQDSATVGHTSPRLFAGLWVGLDDPATGSSLFVYPGSHRLPDYKYGGRYKSVEEAERMAEGGLEQEAARHTDHLLTSIRRGGFERTPVELPFGSVAIMHPDLVHETVGVSGLDVRRTVRAWVCPRDTMPLYAERIPTRRHSEDDYTFISGHYPDLEPLD